MGPGRITLRRQFATTLAPVGMFDGLAADYTWRHTTDAESTTTTPTATFATARVSIGPALSLHAGYDNRRSVRLYRDFLSPEIEFDDSFRQGTWGGAQLSLGHLLAGFDTRTSTGGSSGSSDSWTASAGLTRLTPLGAGVRRRPGLPVQSNTSRNRHSHLVPAGPLRTPRSAR